MICAHCGKVFIPKQPSLPAKFCGRPCALKASRPIARSAGAPLPAGFTRRPASAVRRPPSRREEDEVVGIVADSADILSRAELSALLGVSLPDASE